ncbi:cytochrome c biogenesis heme-transporting ATPase CcmA [Algibacillus agarilyticus]|uniref:cytochrome c biogenesis heme-transporting ATPase CcmA n=1 Tax=Algibacillus agarilyticus TaxID=2234133 RepID=UPI001E2D874F|nr:cytochrome c biogenesis heme-transporting ATPase CcmA [Algibacillus agarilyticus]
MPTIIAHRDKLFLLSVNELTCIRNNRILFEDLSFVLKPGQLMYITGPNGAGKTTLLRSISGLHQYHSGDIELNKQPLSEMLANVLYIGHKAGVNENLTAIDNMQHWLMLTGEKANINEIIEKIGLSGLDNVPVKFLSAGQKRRVALSRLWISTAAIWILDEPYTSIDAVGINVLNQLFKRHVDNGKMVIVTSHQPLPDDLVDVNLNLEYRF